MTEKAPDDIFALCSRLNIDGERYRVFPKPQPALPANQDSTSTVRSDRAFAFGRPQEAEMTGTARVTSSGEISEVRQTSRAMLRSLMRQISAFEPQLDGRRRIEPGSVSCVYGAAGGVGVTSVVATLARLISKRDRRSAIVDSRRESLLKLLFSGQTIPSVDNSTSTGTAQEMSALRIYTPGHWHSQPLPEAQEQERWFEISLGQLKQDFDHVLLDIWPGAIHKVATSAVQPDITLLVAVPDLSSMIGARTFLRQLTSSKSCICVLNKFDASVALHRDVRDWFDQNFARTVCLTRTDLSDEALAEGLTVADWAPESALAFNYEELLSAMDQMACEPVQTSEEEEVLVCQ
jgi:MinD-like ATPase involved in chromosome partitioning or flagellar assembly